MNNTIFFTSLFVFSVMIASFSQVLLKLSAKKTYKNKISEYLNPHVIIAYALFFSTTLITVTCFNFIDLSTGVIIESTGYIFVGFLSYVFLKEKYSKRKLIGTLLIFVGVFIFSL